MTESSNTSIPAQMIERDLKIDKGDLRNSMYDQAQLRSLYGRRANKAKAIMGKAKLELEIAGAKIDKLIRAEALENKTKITENSVAADVKMHPIYIKARNELIAAEEEYDIFTTTTIAFDQRRDMVVQLSKHEAIDRGGELALNAIDSRAAMNQSGAAAMERARTV